MCSGYFACRKPTVEIKSLLYCKSKILQCHKHNWLLLLFLATKFAEWNNQRESRVPYNHLSCHGKGFFGRRLIYVYYLAKLAFVLLGVGDDWLLVLYYCFLIRWVEQTANHSFLCIGKTLFKFLVIANIILVLQVLNDLFLLCSVWFSSELSVIKTISIAPKVFSRLL